MNQSLEIFKKLRVYKRLTLPLLFNDMMCNRAMKLSSLVDLAPTIYKYSSKLIGKNFINLCLQSTYCKIFTAGNTIEEANQASQYFRSEGIPVILDYCAQGDIDKPDLQATLDGNAQLFKNSAELISNYQNQMISIKITGLMDMRILKIWNQSVDNKDKFWNDFQIDGKLTVNSLRNGLKQYNNTITEDDIRNYIRNIHKYTGNLQNFTIQEIQFKMNHHPIYIFNTANNNDKIIRTFFNIKHDDQNKINNFIKRVTNICSPYHKNNNNFRILVDAQQSYVQKAIQSISQQLQQQYNKQRIYIIPTVQNYLKRAKQRANYQIQIAKRKNLKFGAKLVRGAYIVQQSRLAKQFNYDNPVVDCFLKTTDNYLSNFQKIVQNFESSQAEVIVATHNKDTVESALKIKQKYNHPPVVSFAQLLGLADHLTWQLKGDNHVVYKYLPWAETQVMVPYMIRRAQELNQMKYPLDIQYDLLKHELGIRLGLK